MENLDRLINDASANNLNNALHISRPDASAYQVLDVHEAISFGFDKDLIVQAVRSGDDLILTLEDGRLIKLLDYYDHFGANALFFTGDPLLMSPLLAGAGGVLGAAALAGAGSNDGDGGGSNEANALSIETPKANTPAPVIYGNATPGATVSVSVGGATFETIADPETGEWSVNTWSETPVSGVFTPLANGTAEVEATATGPGLEPVDAQTSYTVDVSAPPAPTVDPTNGTAVTGTGEPGATVTVSFGSPEETYVTTVDPNGTWTISPTTPIPSGTVIYANQTDPSGNQSGTSTMPVDGTPPPAPVINPTNGEFIIGTGEPGATVTVTAGGKTFTAIVDPAGNWSVDPQPDLADQTVITATQTDEAGNQSPQANETVDTGVAPSAPIDVVPPDAPTIDPTDGTSVSGTGEPGATVTITGGGFSFTAIVDPNGNWSVDPLNLPVGGVPNNTELTATQQDPTGNASGSASTIVDNVALPPQIEPSNGTTVTGTGEPGATVTVQAGGQTLTATVDPNGNWSVDPEPNLPGGTIITATQTDPIGNISGSANETVDATHVPPPAIDPSDGQKITGTGEPGATVTVEVGGQTLTATVDPNGNWTVDPEPDLGDGEAILARQTVDGTESDPANGTVDASPPGAPGIDPTEGTVVTGTGEPGATVVLTYGSPETTLVTTVDPNGNWSISPSPVIPSGTVLTATQVDPSGNSSGSAVETVWAQLPPPVIEPSGGETITGTGIPGATVAVTFGSPEQTLLTTVDPTGNWSVDPEPNLALGATVSATQGFSNATTSDPASTTIEAFVPVSFINEPTGGNLYGTDDAIQVELSIGQVANVDTTNGTPTIELVIGTETVLAQYVSGSGTDKLVFEYIVQAGNLDADGVEVNAGSLVLNGATLTNGSGQTLDVSNGTATSTANVDGVPPGVITIGGGTSTDPNTDELAIGAAVGAGGDINGDGFEDFIIGAPGVNLGFGDYGSDNGRAFVVFGGAESTTVDLANLQPDQGFEIIGDDSNVAQRISGLGDVNGDGLDDIFVSDFEGTISASGAGYIVYGKADGNDVLLDDIEAGTSTAGTRLTASSPGTSLETGLGRELTLLRDFNGDGYSDLALVSIGQTAAVNANSLVYVLKGGPSIANPLDLQDITGGAPNGFVIEGQSYVIGSSSRQKDFLGSEIAFGGDTNGDGLNDLLLFAPNAVLTDTRLQTFVPGFGYSPPLTSADKTSALHVVWGSTDIVDLFADDFINETTSRGYTITEATGTFASLGDINGDGLDDIAFARGSNIVVVYGKDTLGRFSLNDVAGDPTLGFTISGFDLGLTSISSAGDFNGDGNVDIVAGSNSNFDEAVYVVYGQGAGDFSVAGIENGTSSSGYKITNVTTDGPLLDYNNTSYPLYDEGYVNGGLGTSVSSVGDINGDGFDDIQVSTPSTNTFVYYYDYYGPYGNGTNELTVEGGTSYIIFGNDNNDTAVTDVTDLPNTSGPQVFADDEGTVGDDVITGTTANELFLGDAGNDTIIGGGGTDVLLGASGDDEVIVNASNIAQLEGGPVDDRLATVNGGSGIDRLTLDGSGITLDFSLLDDGRITGIEEIDIAGSGNNTLNLSLDDLFDMSDTSNELTIFGDSGDTVNVADMTGFVQTQESNGGTNFEVYTFGEARLLVEENVSVLI